MQNDDEFDEGLREALACNILNNLKLKLRGNSAQIVNRNLLSPLEIAKQTQQVCSSVYVWIKTRFAVSLRKNIFTHFKTLFLLKVCVVPQKLVHSWEFLFWFNHLFRSSSK